MSGLVTVEVLRTREVRIEERAEVAIKVPAYVAEGDRESWIQQQLSDEKIKLLDSVFEVADETESITYDEVTEV